MIARLGNLTFVDNKILIPKRGTEWLIEAARGKRPWPEEQGEVENYWQRIEQDASLLLAQKRIQLLSTPRGVVAVGDLRDIGHYVDPKSFNQAIASLVALAGLRQKIIRKQPQTQVGQRIYTTKQPKTALYPSRSRKLFIRNKKITVYRFEAVFTKKCLRGYLKSFDDYFRVNLAERNY